MIYGWIIGGLAALDLGIKSVIESEEDRGYGGAILRQSAAANLRLWKKRRRNW